jgi:hypothetical protein
MRAVRSLAATNGWKVVSVGVWNRGSDITRLGIGPLEWIRLIKHAELVVTNYFHGGVFSLLFQRRVFAFVDPLKRGKLSNLFAQVAHPHLLHEPADVRRLPEFGLAACEPDFTLVKSSIAETLARSHAFLEKQVRAVRGAGVDATALTPSCNSDR